MSVMMEPDEESMEHVQAQYLVNALGCVLGKKSTMCAHPFHKV